MSFERDFVLVNGYGVGFVTEGCHVTVDKGSCAVCFVVGWTFDSQPFDGNPHEDVTMVSNDEKVVFFEVARDLRGHVIQIGRLCKN